MSKHRGYSLKYSGKYGNHVSLAVTLQKYEVLALLKTQVLILEQVRQASLKYSWDLWLKISKNSYD